MSTKKSKEQFALELFEKHGLLLESDYLGAHFSIEFKCPNGHTNIGMATNILQRGYKCKQCLHNRPIIPKINWTDEQVEKLTNLVSKLTKLEDIAVEFHTTKTAILNACDKFNISRDRTPGSYKALKEGIEAQNRELLTPYEEFYGISTMLEIKCRNGHIVQQTGGNIRSKGTGCPKCSFIDGKSKTENTLVEFIKANYNGWIELGDRTILSGKELDIVLPDLGLAFEYNGEYWHSEQHVEKDYHLNKTIMTEEFGYRLIHIPEHLWVAKQDIWKSFIRNLLNITTHKIYARKCIVKELDYWPKEFLSNNHLQGSGSPTSINLALEYNNDIVAVMTFSKPRFNSKYEYELVRFCTKLDTRIVGGASKLLKYFEAKFNPTSIISYANKYWSIGNVYSKLKFTRREDTAPGYYYAKKLEIISRYKAQKHLLKDLLKEFDPKMTEAENMNNNGYYKVWDCGNQVWTKEYPPVA